MQLLTLDILNLKQAAQVPYVIVLKPIRQNVCCILMEEKVVIIPNPNPNPNPNEGGPHDDV